MGARGEAAPPDRRGQECRNSGGHSERVKEPLPKHWRVRAHTAPRPGEEKGSPSWGQGARGARSQPAVDKRPARAPRFPLSRACVPALGGHPWLGNPRTPRRQHVLRRRQPPACSRAPRRRSSPALLPRQVFAGRGSGLGAGGAAAGWAGPGAGGSGTCRRRASAAGARRKSAAQPAQVRPGQRWGSLREAPSATEGEIEARPKGLSLPKITRPSDGRLPRPLGNSFRPHFNQSFQRAL